MTIQKSLSIFASQELYEEMAQLLLAKYPYRA